MTKRRRYSKLPRRARHGAVRATRERREALRHLIRAQEGRCAICGEAMTAARNEAPTMATIDHVVPLSRGGTDALSNLRAACLSCNTQRGANE